MQVPFDTTALLLVCVTHLTSQGRCLWKEQTQVLSFYLSYLSNSRIRQMQSKVQICNQAKGCCFFFTIIIARESVILSDDRKSLDYSLCMYAERMLHAIACCMRSHSYDAVLCDQSRPDGDNFEFKALAFRARCGNVLLNMNGPNFKLRLFPDSEGGSNMTLSRFCPIPYTLHSNPLL